MDRLEEAVTIARLMFTQERPSFEGTYYHIASALNRPLPIQDGGPKILIGGGGEKRTLRVLARHGDIGHWFDAPLDALKRKRVVFEEHCAAVGRDPSTVLLTVGMGIVLGDDELESAAILDSLPSERRAMYRVFNVDQAADFLSGYIDAGFGGFTFSNSGLPTLESIGLAGELIKVVRGRS